MIKYMIIKFKSNFQMVHSKINYIHAIILTLLLKLSGQNFSVLSFSSNFISCMLKFGLKLKSLKEGFESALAMSFHCLLPHKKPEDKGQFVAAGWLLLAAQSQVLHRHQRIQPHVSKLWVFDTLKIFTSQVRLEYD